LRSALALPRIDLVLCTRCGVCVSLCPGHAVEMADEGPHFARPLDCTYCAECEATCPAGAIRCEYAIVWAEDPPSPGGDRCTTS